MRSFRSWTNADVWPYCSSNTIQSGCVNVTHHRILSQIIIRPSCYGVQLHQVVKVWDLPVHPFLMTERSKSQYLISSKPSVLCFSESTIDYIKSLNWECFICLQWPAWVQKLWAAPAVSEWHEERENAAAASDCTPYYAPVNQTQKQPVTREWIKEGGKVDKKQPVSFTNRAYTHTHVHEICVWTFSQSNRDSFIRKCIQILGT